MKVLSSTDELRAACTELAASKFITVDTEFLRTNTYWPILCLIQVAGEDEAYIIDPLADGISLEPFYELMDDASVLKVLHAASQDMEIFLHESGRLPHPVFDTQIAAMVCGYGDSVGYETLVNQIARASIDKSSRFTDWSRRPLSDKQLKYAIGDVTHLRTIYETLSRQLEESGRAHWLSEEMDTLTNPATYVQEPEDAWLRLKPRSNNKRFLGRVREVAAWRERWAQKQNVPRNRIIRDDVIMELAAHPPKSPGDLKKIRNFPSHLPRNSEQELMEALKTAAQLPEDQLPSPKKQKRLPKGIGPIVELLKVLLKLRCEEKGVAQKLVANVSDLELIAAEDVAPVAALNGWRREVFGEDALALKRGELALSVANGQIVVSEI